MRYRLSYYTLSVGRQVVQFFLCYGETNDVPSGIDYVICFVYGFIYRLLRVVCFQYTPTLSTYQLFDRKFMRFAHFSAGTFRMVASVSNDKRQAFIQVKQYRVSLT